MERVRVLIITDASSLGYSLRYLLDEIPDLELITTLKNRPESLKEVRSLRPDVILLDLAPGLIMLKDIMRVTPTPVVVVGAATREGTQGALEALAEGAVDFVVWSADQTLNRRELERKIRAAYASKFDVATRMNTTRNRFQAIVETLADKEKPALRPHPAGGRSLVAIAASTGGPMALQFLLTRLPPDFPAGVVIALHIAPGFTAPLAARLNELSPITVREAENGAPIRPGLALIVPAGRHATIAGRGGELSVRLSVEPTDTLYRPSADILFHSIAKCCAAQTCAVILTGMGDDGAQGLYAIREQGGYTIAQDQATSIVYGMPRRAVELGGVDISLPLDQIAAEILRVAELRS
jgi:two-component system chemotaxis response regulator CheB